MSVPSSTASVPEAFGLGDAAAAREPKPSRATWLAAIRDRTLPVPVRLELLNTAQMIPCTNLRELVFGKDGKVKTLLNDGSVNVTDDQKQKAVTIDLDAKFLDHLGSDPNCKGVVVFTRTAGARARTSDGSSHR